MEFSIRPAEPDVHPLHGQPRRRKRESPPREFEEQLEPHAPRDSAPPERAPHGGDEEGVGERIDVVA
jgi:hypothetical protein